MIMIEQEIACFLYYRNKFIFLNINEYFHILNNNKNEIEKHVNL